MKSWFGLLRVFSSVFSFYIATASGGETWYRIETSENFPALWGEIPAVCGDPSDRAEETSQSPGWEKTEEYWQGAGRHRRLNTILAYLNWSIIKTPFQILSHSQMAHSIFLLYIILYYASAINRVCDTYHSELCMLLLQLQAFHQKHKGMTFNQTTYMQVPKPPPYISQLSLKKRQQQQKRKELQAQVW